MKPESFKHWNSMIDGMLVPLLMGLSGVLAMAMFASLKWRMSWDLPVLVYPVFAADRFGLVLYRDIFDVNMAGTHFIHYLWGHFLGYTDTASRWADMGYLCFLMATLVFMLRRLGWNAAWMAALLFGLAYVQQGRTMSMQREYLMLPLIALGAGCAIAFPKRSAGWRAVCAGLCFGTVSCIKPHAAIGLPLVILFLYCDTHQAAAPHTNRLGRFAALIGFAALGFAVPTGILFAYVAWTGALPNFLDMACHYWPLYGSLSRTHKILAPGERLPYLWENYRLLGHYTGWLLPALFGLFTALSNTSYPPRLRRYLYLLAALAFAYSLYPCIQGQFFNYHWLPLLMFLSVLIALNIIAIHHRKMVLPRFIPLAILLMTVYAQFFAGNALAGLFPKVDPNHRERWDRIADFLKQRLEPGDTVQPLDWVSGGVLNAMRIAEAKLATPFIYDVSFYHHVSEPYIQKLRQRFIHALDEAAPRFIVQGRRPRGEMVSGPDTSYDFPALAQLLNEKYRPAVQDPDFTIFERKHALHNPAASPPGLLINPPSPLQENTSAMRPAHMPAP